MSRYLRITFTTTFFLLITSCHVGRFFIWNFADANDHKKFQKIDIQNRGDFAGEPFQFINDRGIKKTDFPKTVRLKKKEYNFEEAMEKSGTVALLVIRNDSVLYEQYWQNRGQASIHPSFSVAKSVTSMLVGIAIEEGKIKSLDEPITNYLPTLPKGEGFEKITIEHLLDMRSGIKFNEGYFNPFGNVAKFYYGRNIKRYIPKLEIERAPDERFQYKSINTQLLSLIVENATQQPIAKYLEEKIWHPLGMEYDASWSVDSKKQQTVKAFCCLNARARDFAKLGRLYLNNGNWNGKQIVPVTWVKQSTTFDAAKNNFLYSYQWWHNREYQIKSDTTIYPALYTEREVILQKDGKKTDAILVMAPYNDFYAEGILGQFIYVHPSKNMIIVRLGKKYGDVSWNGLFRKIAEIN